MRYSPKLKKVMAQIEQIIKENDLAAMVILVEPGFSEHLTVIDPSFSLAKFENGRMVVTTKGLNLNPLEKAQKLANTANFMHLLAATATYNTLALQRLSDFVTQKTGAKHSGLTHTSQDEIDN